MYGRAKKTKTNDFMEKKVNYIDFDLLMQEQIVWMNAFSKLMFIGHSFIYSLLLFSFVNQKDLNIIVSTECG